VAYEVFMDLGGRMPRNLVLPIGSGTLLIATYIALREMEDSGYIRDDYRIIGVEAAGYEEVYREIYGQSGLEKTDIADGLRVVGKPRKRQVVEIIKKCGDVVVVSHDEILAAWSEIWRAGYLVEPTTAAIYAGFKKAYEKQMLEKGEVLIPLTGSGLKMTELAIKHGI
jgi:threonine synthase